MSGLAFNYDSKENEPVDTYEVYERLCLTEDERLVSEGDPAGRWLYAIPGQKIPMAEAIRYGLVDGPPSESKVEEPAPAKKSGKRQRRLVKKES